jgi:gluconolactonase
MSMVHPSLKIFNDDVKSFIRTEFDIETLSDQCEFTEGPVWDENGFYLFSDIPANCIYKMSETGKR